MVNLAALDARHGNSARARRTYEEALTRARAINSIEIQANILNLLAQRDQDEGDLTSAHRHFTESLGLFTQIKDADPIKLLTQELAELTLIEQVAAARKANPTFLASGGVLITLVTSDGQAAAAGIAPGDLLLRYNADPLDKLDTLRRLAKDTPATKPVTIEALRGGKKLTFKVHGGLLGVGLADLPPAPSTRP